MATATRHTVLVGLGVGLALGAAFALAPSLPFDAEAGTAVARLRGAAPIAPERVALVAAPAAQWATGRLLGMNRSTDPYLAYRRYQAAAGVLVGVGLAAVGLLCAAFPLSAPGTALALVIAAATRAALEHGEQPLETSWVFPVVALSAAAAAWFARTRRLALLAASLAGCWLAALLHLSGALAIPGTLWLASGGATPGPVPWRSRLGFMLRWGAATAVALYLTVWLVFSASSWSLAHPIQLFLVERRGGLFGGGALRAAANLPFGLAHAVLGLDGWSGLRAWLARPGDLLPVGGRVLLSLLFLSGGFWVVLRSRETAARTLALTALLWLASAAVAAWWWAPTYLKLWMITPAAVAVLLAAGWTVGPRWFRWAALAWLIAAFLLPVRESWSGSGSVAESQYRTARAIAARAAGAPVLTSGWDPLSGHLQHLAARQAGGGGLLDLVSVAVQAGMPARAATAEVTRTLFGARDRACREGTTMRVIGILDTPPESWEPFWRARLGLGYSVVEELRRSARFDTSYALPRRRLGRVETDTVGSWRLGC